ncbi:MAG: hypothetical protein AAFO07_25720 [Bacteroidota bacterium]
MKPETLKKFIYLLLILTLFLMIACQDKTQEKETCVRYLNENYLEPITDISIINEAFEYHMVLLEMFDENSVKDFKNEAYHLQFYSSHGYGKSVKFEKRLKGGTISVKCIRNEDWFTDCRDYQIEIDSTDWRILENIIYEFDFWTVEDFRSRKNVLDGYVYFLEGNRPEAITCNKKIYKLVARASPKYDKIEALCENILEFEHQLEYSYEQMGKLK